MPTFTPSTANKVTVDMVAKATGSAITTGTVNVYLVQDVGENAGKWWNSPFSSWSAIEVSAGTATYKGGSAWQLSIAAAAWVTGAKYTLYAKESGNLNIPYSVELTQSATATGNGSTVVSDTYAGGDYTVKTPEGAGIDNVQILAYLTSDYTAGNTGTAYVKGKTTTTTTGEWSNTLSLDPGTYTLHLSKQGEYEDKTQSLVVT